MLIPSPNDSLKDPSEDRFGDQDSNRGLGKTILPSPNDPSNDPLGDLDSDGGLGKIRLYPPSRDGGG